MSQSEDSYGEMPPLEPIPFTSPHQITTEGLCDNTMISRNCNIELEESSDEMPPLEPISPTSAYVLKYKTKEGHYTDELVWLPDDVDVGNNPFLRRAMASDLPSIFRVFRNGVELPNEICK